MGQLCQKGDVITEEDYWWWCLWVGMCGFSWEFKWEQDIVTRYQISKKKLWGSWIKKPLSTKLWVLLLTELNRHNAHSIVPFRTLSGRGLSFLYYSMQEKRTLLVIERSGVIEQLLWFSLSLYVLSKTPCLWRILNSWEPAGPMYLKSSNLFLISTWHIKAWKWVARGTLALINRTQRAPFNDDQTGLMATCLPDLWEFEMRRTSERCASIHHCCSESAKHTWQSKTIHFS